MPVFAKPAGHHFGKLPDLRASPRGIGHPVELDHLPASLRAVSQVSIEGSRVLPTLQESMGDCRSYVIDSG